MSQQFVVVARKNMQKPEEPVKYYALARSMRSVTVDEICRRISERATYSLGELEGTIGEFLVEIKNVLTEGSIAQIGKLGSFRLSLKTAKPTSVSEDFKSSNVKGSKVLFHPSTQLQDLCKTMKYAPYKVDPEKPVVPEAPEVK